MNLNRHILVINGIERDVLCNPEKDSLAAVVRRLGLTGTKVGCGTGQCGACSLLLDGKLVRSCVKKMKSVRDHAQVETIEGLGNPESMHPLQLAFITYAGVQCGFCSPGFIMSAKALLLENPAPTRQEVRSWFTRHNNICRCTGYKPIVDAVIAAAAVMRGEKTLDDITFVMPTNGRIYGTHFPKPTAVARVTGACDFGADVAEKMPNGTLHLAVVLARRHHARIKHIGTSAALSVGGVVRVITAADVKGTNRLLSPQGKVRYHGDGRDHPVICDDAVRRYGDVVAVVAAYTREAARVAAAKVEVEYEDLPALMHYTEAVAPGAPRIHAGTPNVYLEQPLLKGEDTRQAMRESAAVAEGSFASSRQPHLTIEPDVVQAYPQDDGVTIQCKTQYLYGNIACMAEAIGLPKEKIRIILNPAGGSFGYSMSPAAYALAAVCALALDSPVALVLDYDEHQHFTGKRSPLYTNARLACDENGYFTAMEFHAGLDHGAYSDLAGALTSKVCRFFGYPYSVPRIRGLVQTAFTNNNFGIAFRAFGSPQAYLVSEQLVDMLANKINMDPFELRYRNVARSGDLCTNSVPYRVYPMLEMMDRLRPLYEEACRRAENESTETRRCGVGLAWGGYQVGKSPDHAEVDLELNQDGSVTYYSTWADVGQGADTGALMHTHEALRELGLSPTQIRLVRNDTSLCPDTGSASGSRSHHASGMATIDAARNLMSAMRKEDGTWRSWQEMHDAGLPTRFRGVYDSNWPDVDPDDGHGYGSIGQNFMLFMAEVTVDMTSGKTEVTGATIVADIGVVGSKQAVLGQAWGGFSHSVGFALSENHEDMKKHATMLGAGIPRCNDVPDNFRVIFHQTPREDGPHGSTGCAEGFQSAGHAAILNGIAQAAGVRIFTLPATPYKVKVALQSKAVGTLQAQSAWYLGCGLHERLNELRVAR
jgi:aldehyde oxidoreductase